MSDMTVFVINGDQKAILKSLKEVFNTEENPQELTPMTTKNYYLTPLQAKHATKYLKQNELLIFNEFADSFTRSYNERPSNVNLTRYLRANGYEKYKRIVSNHIQNYWTKS